ncbi:7221_t:CDS:2 [Funneliformis caledonium]|uniref:7221_t:CDS:1 n=1 Tax=Funneliformis caledonium TaxID=1117310 RepID=A0A9N8ZW61_9GLOM|nr:7221_t:CDS:2 [Funneliformis caledonium]
MTTTAIIPQEVKTSLEEQNYPFKPNCGSRVPIYANLSDSAQQLEQNLVWEPLGAEKSFDLNQYINFANFSKKYSSYEPSSYFTVSSRRQYTNPLACVNSPYYDHLVNGGGSFNGGNGTTLNGCTTDIDNENLVPQQQGQLYNIMNKLPPSSSAWSSFEDLNTPTTATTNSTATSRCSTPANSGFSFNEQIKLEPFVAQQHKDVLNPTPLKSRPSFQDLTSLKKRTSVSDLSPSHRGNGVQAFDNNKSCSNNGAVNANNNQQHAKVRRSSNTTIMSNATVMSDTTSEQSDKSTAIESEKEQKKATLYKTEMCRNWEERGSCRYGAKCQFAHSANELRIVQHHPKYKTEICKTFWQNGTCPYGKRCCFIHNDKERLLLCKRHSADNLKNSNKKDKSKGLSKFGSDSALYGSYQSDSSNSSNGAPIPSTPSMSPIDSTPSSSSNDDSLRAFADAYFSPSHNITMSPETIVSNNTSPPTIRDDDITASSNSSPNNTPTKKRSTNFPCNGVLGFNTQLGEDDESSAFVDDPLMSSGFLNEAMDDGAKSLMSYGAFPNDLLLPRVDRNTRSQERRRASKTSCKLEV